MAYDDSSLPPRGSVHNRSRQSRQPGRGSLADNAPAEVSSVPAAAPERRAGRPGRETRGGSRSRTFHPVLATAAILLGVFMAILDTSIVNVAIPKMMAVFNVNQLDIQWVLTAYTLVVGALVPVTGYLGDRFGYKKVLVTALVIFTVGSGLCGAAWSNGAMIAFRIVQAIGGGALMPISMAMIYRMYPPEKRGLAMGVFGIAIMFAPAMGPTLSGYITEYMNWRLIFYLNVPLGILDIFLALAVLEEYRSETRHRFDAAGFVTSTVGFSTLLYALGEAADKGWGNQGVLTFMAVAAVSLILFIATELTVKEPMLDIKLMRNLTFTVSLAITSVSSLIMMGGLFLLPIFLQNLMGHSALQTGLILLPQAIAAGLMMPLSGYLFDKIGGRPLAVAGLLLTALSQYLTTRLSIDTPNHTLIFWLVLRSFGIGMVMMPLQTAAMNTLPMKKMGQGSALINTVRQVSASFGIAWLALLLTNRDAFHLARNKESYNLFSTPILNQLGALQRSFAALGQGAEQSRQSALRYLYGQIQIHSMVQAMDDVFFVTAIVAVGAAAISLFLRNSRIKRGSRSSGSMMGE